VGEKGDRLAEFVNFYNLKNHDRLTASRVY
jgi:hypothetical protein